MAMSNVHVSHWKTQVKSKMLMLCGIQYSSNRLYIEHTVCILYALDIVTVEC